MDTTVDGYDTIKKGDETKAEGKNRFEKEVVYNLAPVYNPAKRTADQALG